MLSTLKRWRNGWLGREEAACSVPIFDGALKPNHLLEEADVFYQAQDARDLCSDGQKLWLADGQTILSLDVDGGAEVVLQVGRKVTALCAWAGGVAYAVEGGQVHVHGGEFHGQVWSQVDGHDLNNINALSARDGGLVATQGSQAFGLDRWQHDLMSHGKTGRVFYLSARSSSACDKGPNWAHAYGAVPMQDSLWVSESWAHRVLSLGADGVRREVVAQLPGYPSRMSHCSSGGVWLTVFACRTQLVEFVLREKAFRERMMNTMPAELWVAPQLSSGNSFLEPLQGGGIKQMGVLKPWAPPRSYGLVIRLNDKGIATHSLHSRGGGRHHGVVAVAECADHLYVLSAGSHRVLRIPLRNLT
jgi:hypothetical protein